MRVSRLVLRIASAALLLTPITVVRASDGPPYKISLNVVERSAQVIDFSSRPGKTKLEFHGADLRPGAHGEIEVESRNGSVVIETEIKDLTPAAFFGGSTLTYVLWAITPEGRAMNISEVLIDDGNKSKFAVATNLDAFGLIVTAEPYFAVSQPTDAVVLESFWGTGECIAGKSNVTYQLLAPQSLAHLPAKELATIYTEQIVTPDVAQAQNALRIAWWSNAAIYAPESYAKAKRLLQAAESDPKSNHEGTSTAARAAVIAAEDARALAIMRQAGTAHGNSPKLISTGSLCKGGL
jgi:hypothetical protein